MQDPIPEAPQQHQGSLLQKAALQHRQPGSSRVQPLPTTEITGLTLHITEVRVPEVQQALTVHHPLPPPINRVMFIKEVPHQGAAAVVVVAEATEAVAVLTAVEVMVPRDHQDLHLLLPHHQEEEDK